jgi:NhaA family Na+:H+ antiporter
MMRAMGGESAAGILLIVVAICAVVIANSPFATLYHDLFHHPLGWTPVAKLNSWHLWINDALMAVFFFVVGLEIKREVLDGELATPAQRRLPVLAAAAGMIAPALVFIALTRADPATLRGWAIPAATDIAFAVGVLALVGKRAPPSLRLFLLTVAIVDDLGAVVIIALVYTSGIKAAWLAVGAACLGGMVLLGRWRVERAWPYVLLAIACWYAVLHSGVHATVAGVLAALAIPLRLDSKGDSLLLRMEHALVPWNGYVIVPLFGLANAGVALGAFDPAAGFALALAIAAGLFVGKQVGILAAIWLADRTGVARRPAGASWHQLWGMAALCGIGFTMSLFIAALAFPGHPDLVEQAKLGILAGSLVSALLGYAVLRLAPVTRQT